MPSKRTLFYVNLLVQASWSQLSVDGAVLADATNLTGTLLATSSSTPEGSAQVQVQWMLACLQLSQNHTHVCMECWGWGKHVQ